MKKYLITCFAMLCTAAVYCSIQTAFNPNPQDELLLRNIEALTQEEQGFVGYRTAPLEVTGADGKPFTTYCCEKSDYNTDICTYWIKCEDYSK